MTSGYCALCGKPGTSLDPLDKHHIFGGSNRRNSERYGLVVPHIWRKGRTQLPGIHGQAPRYGAEDGHGAAGLDCGGVPADLRPELSVRR